MHQAEHLGLVPQHGQIRNGLAAVGKHHRELEARPAGSGMSARSPGRGVRADVTDAERPMDLLERPDNVVLRIRWWALGPRGRVAAASGVRACAAPDMSGAACRWRGWGYSVMKSPIMAMSSCSRLWQWIMKAPG